MSRCLAERSIDHVVLERGEVAHSWRTQRWDSLRLLTPNWMTRLPGYAYRGDDPDGYLSARQVAALLEDYAEESRRRCADTTVTSVRPAEAGTWCRPTRARGARRRSCSPRARRACPRCRRWRGRCPPGSPRVTPADYRNPGELPDGGVLVVGASASGIQIADELHRSGRPVTLAVGEHVRMPRTYRGRDILWWMDAAGLLDERYDEIPTTWCGRASLPSMQLVGSPSRDARPERADARPGCGWSAGWPASGTGSAQFSGSLPNVCALADLKLGRLLDTIDAWAARAGRPASGSRRPSCRARAAALSTCGPARSARSSGRPASGPDLSWLDVPVFDRKGRVVHDGGVTAAPGLYLIGLPFLRRRKSTLIDGAAADAAELTEHLVRHLDARSPVRGRAERSRHEHTIPSPPRSPPPSPAATAGGWPPR